VKQEKLALYRVYHPCKIKLLWKSLILKLHSNTRAMIFFNEKTDYLRFYRKTERKKWLFFNQEENITH